MKEEYLNMAYEECYRHCDKVVESVILIILASPVCLFSWVVFKNNINAENLISPIFMIFMILLSAIIFKRFLLIIYHYLQSSNLSRQLDSAELSILKKKHTEKNETNA